MSLVSEAISASTRARDYVAGPRDYVSLLKPRVMSLVVLTALAGMLIAPDPVHPVIGFASLLAIAVGAGAAGRAQHVVGRRHRRADGAHPAARRSPRA